MEENSKTAVDWSRIPDLTTHITALCPAPGWRAIVCEAFEGKEATFRELPVIGWGHSSRRR